MNYEHIRWDVRNVRTLERWSAMGGTQGASPERVAWLRGSRWEMEDGRAEIRGRRSEGKDLRPPTSGVARPHHQSSATNDPSPAYRLIRSSPCETVGARARLDELLHFPGLQVNYSNLAARITRDVCHSAIRADQHLLRRAWHLERAGHLHRLQVNHAELVVLDQRDQQPAPVGRRGRPVGDAR